ncbi:MAG: hypothetical protein ACOWWH_12625 [Eubacteriaceae bacterium]
MSLSQADLQVIQTVFGKTAEELSGALSSEQEVSLGLRLNGRVITQEDEKNLKESGIQQGKELGYKEVAKNLGLTLDSGEKDPIIIADKLKTDLSKTLEDKYKNMTPTDELLEVKQKAEEWEQKYNKLNGTYETTKSEITEWQNKYEAKEKEIKTKELNNIILSSFPDKMKMDRNDALLIAKNAFEFDYTDNGVIVKKDGNIITDPVGNPDKIDNIIKSFVEEKQWIKGSGMNGSDRSDNNRLPRGMDDDKAMQYIKESGKDPMSPEGSKMFIELTSKE